MLRIALYHNLPSGGAKRAVYEWTRRLVTNHQVDVYTLSSADHDFCDLRPFVQQYRVFEFTEQRLFNSPFGRLNQLQRWRDLGNLVEIGRHIANEINTGQYDVVFANGCFYTFIPAFLQFIELPAVYYLHEPFRQSPMHLLKRPYLSNNGWRNSLNRFDPLIKLYQQRLEAIRHKSIKQTRCFLSNSQFTRRQIKMDYAVDAPVCYLGVDVEKFQSLPVEREDNIIMSVGELSPRKGFDFLIESLAYIPLSKRPKLKIVCNNIVPLEKEYIQRLAVQRRVDLQILTNLNTDDLALEYNKAQFCVYAPVSEPFGLVPLEAMACGTSVVGVREGGVQETVVDGYTGLLTDRDPRQFAAAVQHLLMNPNVALEYGRNGRDYVQCHWTWDKAVATLESYLLAARASK